MQVDIIMFKMMENICCVIIILIVILWKEIKLELLLILLQKKLLLMEIIIIMMIFVKKNIIKRYMEKPECFSIKMLLEIMFYVKPKILVVPILLMN